MRMLLGIPTEAVINMTDEQAGRLLEAVEAMNKNMAGMAADIKEQTRKLNHIETVLFDNNVGIVKDFRGIAERVKHIEDYIVKQKAYIVVLGAIGSGLVLLVKYVLAALKILS